MILKFDRGTILLKNLSEEGSSFGQPSPLTLPGVLWDARVKSFRAPAFRYGEIRRALQLKNIQIHDFVPHRAVLDGQWSKMELRPYQEEALGTWNIADRRGIVVLPTGSGKTRVALAAMARSRLKTICLVPTRVLLEQWKAEIAKVYSSKIGIYGDGERELHPITIATFESAYRHMNQLGNYFDLLVIDEVHHFGHGVRDEILEMSIAQARLGLTATLTDNELNRHKLKDLIGNSVCEMTIGDLSGKYLASFDLFSIHLHLTITERMTYETNMRLFREFNSKFRNTFPDANWPTFARFASRTEEGRKAMSALQEARRLTTFTQGKAETLEALLTRHWDRKILIFTADTATAYNIAKKYLVMPLTAQIGRKERENVLRHFQTGALRALVSCRVLNEGIDIPDADLAIIVGGAHGEREHVQRIGRLLRPAPGKRALVYELICRNTLETRQWKKRSVGFDSRIAAQV